MPLNKKTNKENIGWSTSGTLLLTTDIPYLPYLQQTARNISNETGVSPSCRGYN